MKWSTGPQHWTRGDTHPVSETNWYGTGIAHTIHKKSQPARSFIEKGIRHSPPKIGGGKITCIDGCDQERQSLTTSHHNKKRKENNEKKNDMKVIGKRIDLKCPIYMTSLLNS